MCCFFFSSSGGWWIQIKYTCLFVFENFVRLLPLLYSSFKQFFHVSWYIFCPIKPIFAFDYNDLKSNQKSFFVKCRKKEKSKLQSSSANIWCIRFGSLSRDRKSFRRRGRKGIRKNEQPNECWKKLFKQSFASLSENNEWVKWKNGDKRKEGKRERDKKKN